MLAKPYRLKKKKDFEKVIKKGKGLREDFLILKFRKNDLGRTRIGFVVSQKVAKRAVKRNKIKRRMREAVRKKLRELKPGYDMVFFAQKGSEEKEFKEIEEKVVKIFQRAKLLKNA